MQPAVTLKGRVSSRSSKKPGGPPGEREILKLNPQRREGILEITGWQTLEPGSLNVECDENELRRILDAREVDLFEPAESVRYPQRYAHIPERRKGYRYYRGMLQHGKTDVPVLLRRAINPLRGRVEVFAEQNLRELFEISDDDEVILLLPSSLSAR